MKKRTTILATILAVSILCTSCSDIFGKNRIKGKNILQVFQDLDYTEVDIDDIGNSFEGFREDDIESDVEDGAYTIASDKKDIKKVFEDYDQLNYLTILCDYDKHMEEVYWFAHLENNDTNGMLLTAAVIKFDSEDSAAEYLEDLTDKKDDKDDTEWDFDDGEDGKLTYLIGNVSSDEDDYIQVDAYIGIYQQGCYVFILAGADIETDDSAGEIEDICEAIDIESPTDV